MGQRMMVAALFLSACGRLGFDAEPSGADANLSCASTSSDLIAWYSFDGANPSVLSDRAGEGFDATCSDPNCPLITAGRINDARAFDRDAPHFATVSNPELFSARLSETGSYSIALWARIDERQASGTYTLVAKRLGAGELNSFQLGLAPSTVFFFIADTVRGRQADLPAPEPFPFGEWIHITTTWDAASQTRSLWFGAELVASDQVDGVDFDDGAMLIGADPDNSINDELSGVLDEVRVYSTALDGARVAELVECADAL